MLELPHALVGAAIATAVHNPGLALPLAFASHFATDMFPHWNPHIESEKRKTGHYGYISIAIIIVDSAAALFVGNYVARLSGNYWTVLLSCFAAVLPDVIEIPHYFLNLRIHFVESLLKFQKAHQWDVPMFWGLLAQAIVCVGCLYFILSA